jgi:hypothetical protein
MPSPPPSSLSEESPSPAANPVLDLMEMVEEILILFR